MDTTINQPLEIIMDETLEIHEIRRASSEDFIRSLRITSGELKHQEMSANVNVFHKNYLQYVDICYSYHRGVIISPTMLWNIFLNEIASYIKDNAEKCRSLFTEKPEGKTEVVINQGGYILDPTMMCAALRPHIPSNIDAFIPSFSTDTPNATIALHATFLDAMSPYFSYGMMLCGIPKYKIMGTIEDWEKFLISIGNVLELFGDEANSKYSKLTAYGSRVMDLVGRIGMMVECGEGDVEFMKTFFVDEPCGSGSQSELSGWLVDFFFDNSKRYLENFPTHVASFEYTNYNELGDPKYKMYTGLFGSTESEDNFLVPDYGYLVYKQ